MLVRAMAVLVLIGAAGTAAAWERMQRSDCQLAFEKLANFVGSADASELARQLRSIRVSPDGWCEMRSSDPGFDSPLFEVFAWRADEVARWTQSDIPPLALDLRVTGVDPDELEGRVSTRRPDLTVEVTLRQMPDAGQLLVERAVMFNSAGDDVSFTGVFERVFLSSPSMVQVSLGSVVYKTGVATLSLEGSHKNPFGLPIDMAVASSPRALRGFAFDLVSRLPDGVLDDASRAELTAFAGDLPGPRGTLEIALSSERGLGLMQVGMSVWAQALSVMDDSLDADTLAVLLSGLTARVDWSPIGVTTD